jgi:hypothetical protein
MVHIKLSHDLQLYHLKRKFCLSVVFHARVFLFLLVRVLLHKDVALTTAAVVACWFLRLLLVFVELLNEVANGVIWEL